MTKLFFKTNRRICKRAFFKMILSFLKRFKAPKNRDYYSA